MFVCSSVAVSVCEESVNCTEGFCVIVLSSEACREEGHVLSSDHSLLQTQQKGGVGAIVRQGEAKKRKKVRERRI